MARASVRYAAIPGARGKVGQPVCYDAGREDTTAEQVGVNVVAAAGACPLRDRFIAVRIPAASDWSLIHRGFTRLEGNVTSME